MALLPNCKRLIPPLQVIVVLFLINKACCDTFSTSKKQKPNIILFLTDDQDIELGSLNFMPKTVFHMKDKGVEFRHAYVTTPMCCPSRSSMLTGMYVHNHQVFTNKDNCSSLHWQTTHELKNFAVYLSNAGYRTGYFGKYLNKYNGSHIPPGWREWGGLIMNSKYYNYSLNMNGQTIKHGFEYDKDYYTDVITKDAINFIRNSKKQNPNKPIMLVMAFPAPHGPEDSAPQYSNMFFNITTHHTPSYNYAPNPDKQWILQVTNEMEQIHKEFTNLLMTKRLQTLQSVDDAVETVVNELKLLGELDDSYLIYTSDHGYHLGQFGLVKGKSFPFEFDVRVPFFMRGPGIESGATLKEIVLNIDLAPTFLDLAGVKVPPHMDGRSILPLVFKSNRKRINWKDTFLIESSGRRETPHLNSKQLENTLLEFSVPQNGSELNSTDVGNVTQAKNDSKSDGYLTTNRILQFKRATQHSRFPRDATKCILDSKLGCQKRQKWYCRMSNGKLRKFRCKEEKGVVPHVNKNKQCVCFTPEGPIFGTYLMKSPRTVHLQSHRTGYKFCHCDNEDDDLEADSKELTSDERKLSKKQRKKEEVCHLERMTCFEHNNDHWRTEPKWNSGPFCFCMNANNNTYSCLRTININHDFLYCEFTTGAVTFYNLRIDPFELKNRYEYLSVQEQTYLKNLLKSMISCRGSGCSVQLDTRFRLNGEK